MPQGKIDNLDFSIYIYLYISTTNLVVKMIFGTNNNVRFEIIDSSSTSYTMTSILVELIIFC